MPEKLCWCGGEIGPRAPGDKDGLGCLENIWHDDWGDYQGRDSDIRFLLKFSGRCCAEVSRKGESQPCDKTAVAVTIDSEDGHWWPVCPHHSRGRRMVPLTDLLKAIAE